MSKNGVFGSENACKWGRITKMRTEAIRFNILPISELWLIFDEKSNEKCVRVPFVRYI